MTFEKSYQVTKNLIGKQVVAKVTLHNYRFPKTAPVSGAFAIIVFNVKEVVQGEIDSTCTIGGESIVVSGRMPKIEEGMEYLMTGTLAVDKKWGPQYNCDSIQLAYNMNDKKDQKKFFSFFMTDKQIDTLFESVEDPLTLLEQKNIGELVKIKGVGPATANRMCTKYAENINKGRAYVELKDLGLTKNAIDKLIEQFGSADAVVELINQNPYSLINLVRGYGWERADKIAQNQGFGHGCKERCIAYTLYLLNKAANEEGNSKTDIQELMNNVEQMCSPTEREQLAEWIKERTVGDDKFEEVFEKVKDRRFFEEKPLFYYSKEAKSIALFSLRVTEKQIAEEIQRLTEAPCRVKFDHETCEKIIKETEQKQGFEYTHEQKRAIWNILDNNVSILTGSAGVGKSSTVRPLVRIFEYYGLTAAQCALSGRAASLLTNYTGLEGKTIHRLLAYLPEKERFAHTKSNPLTEDVIILDEASMVGEELFLSLISSIKSGSKLIMLGDTHQLPPISVGNILTDSIKSGYISTNVLTIIQRQAMKSGIIAQSLHVCEGKSIVNNEFSGEEIRGELKDFKIIGNSEPSVLHRKVIEEFKRLHFDEKIPVDDIQIIVPVRSRGINCCRFFNAEIQSIVNDKATNKDIVTEVLDNGQKFQVHYKPGDRIIVTKNNYHAKTTDGKEVAIFNGNLGHIIDLDYENMIIKLNDADEQVIIPRDCWGDISHSYAYTCHRGQGSQAMYVIVCLDNSSYSLLMREWLYTALTRARKYCILIGQPKAINTAARVSNIKVKKTWLKDDLYKMYMESK